MKLLSEQGDEFDHYDFCRVFGYGSSSIDEIVATELKRIFALWNLYPRTFSPDDDNNGTMFSYDSPPQWQHFPTGNSTFQLNVEDAAILCEGPGLRFTNNLSRQIQKARTTYYGVSKSRQDTTVVPTEVFPQTQNPCSTSHATVVSRLCTSEELSDSETEREESFWEEELNEDAMEEESEQIQEPLVIKKKQKNVMENGRKTKKRSNGRVARRKPVVLNPKCSFANKVVDFAFKMVRDKELLQRCKSTALKNRPERSRLAWMASLLVKTPRFDHGNFLKWVRQSANHAVAESDASAEKRKRCAKSDTRHIRVVPLVLATWYLSDIKYSLNLPE